MDEAIRIYHSLPFSRQVWAFRALVSIAGSGYRARLLINGTTEPDEWTAERLPRWCERFGK